MEVKMPLRCLLLSSSMITIITAWASPSSRFICHAATKANRISNPLQLLTNIRGGTATTPSTRTTSLAKMSGSTSPTMNPVSTAKKDFKEYSKAYAELISKLEIITQLNRVASVLDYDRVVFMSQNDLTSAERGAQLSALAGLIHEKDTDPVILDLISRSESDLSAYRAVEENENPMKEETRILELSKKHYLENERVPAELAAKQASLSSQAYLAWVKARTDDDFPSFEPVLRDCFDTAKEVAAAKRGDGDTPLYNQMLDQFETGMSKKRLDDVFCDIQEALVPLISRVLASPDAPSKDPLHGKFPLDRQTKLNERIVEAIGFDKTLGRIDVSVHPFTSSASSKDVRITSRFSEDEWYQGLAGTVHEGGHAIYEQNMGPSALSIDSALSMGTHESQSLFWERHVGLSKPFWNWAAPILKEELGDFDYSPEEVYGAVNAVSPSFVRVEADELTYPLHVILRYKIEKEVMEGTLAVHDLPQRWNQEMKSLLDVDVPSDTLGCLQDVHWSALAFGYFPTYLIGSATAAQLAFYCRKDIPDMDRLIEAGQFSKIREWLTDKVHRHGKRYGSLDDLLEDQLGERLNSKYFIDYLTEKYSDLYNL